MNYKIHTDAIKEKLIPPECLPAQVAYTYANEADMLNVVLFGKTAKQWKDENPTLNGICRMTTPRSITGTCESGKL